MAKDKKKDKKDKKDKKKEKKLKKEQKLLAAVAVATAHSFRRWVHACGGRPTQDQPERVREGDGKAAGRAGQDAGMGQSHRRQDVRVVRRTRYRRQGRRDQAHYRAGQPAHLPCGGAWNSPTAREKSQMYFQRYMPYLPAAGEVVLFDRSWYNRAGVERVMGFATQEQVDRFLKYTPAAERLIIDSGVILIKYWLEVDMDEQAKRFKERDQDYRKIWKLSPMDVEAQARWYDYSRARDAMFEATDTLDCPWYVVPSNDQRKARLNCITHFLSLIPYEEVPREPIKFPKRQSKGDYEEPNYPYQGCTPEILTGRM